jgi:FkbM family methyltransferase
VIFDELPQLRRIIRTTLWRFGVDVRRYNVALYQTTQLVTLLNAHSVDLAIDVGANIGQFAEDLVKAGYSGAIVSFEPLSAAYGTLVERAKAYRNWIVAPRTALGEEEGQTEIAVSANLVSSSILPMSQVHSAAAPHSKYREVEAVPIRRLDKIELVSDRHKNIFLKIDTQGYEDKVLRGASGLLPRVQILQLEMSLVELYQGQPLLGSMLDKLQGYGYELWALWPGFADPRSGRHLQVDGVFVKSTQQKNETGKKTGQTSATPDALGRTT